MLVWEKEQRVGGDIGGIPFFCDAALAVKERCWACLRTAETAERWARTAQFRQISAIVL